MILRHFGSVAALRAAGVEQIREVKGVGPKLAETIVRELHADDPAPTAGASGVDSPGESPSGESPSGVGPLRDSVDA